MLFGDLCEELLAQVDAAPLVAFPQVVENLVLGEAARPGEEFTIAVVLVVLLPEHKTGLLVEVLDIGLMVNERADEGIDPPLMPDELGHEIGPHDACFGIARDCAPG
jgi:hypothetical protein